MWPLRRSLRRISWSEIDRYEPRTYRPSREFGGWSIRRVPGKFAYDVGGNQGVWIQRTHNRSLLVGYGLSGTVHPPASALIERMNDHPARVLSLDVPSGRDATTGEPLGATVSPDRTVTLALPKTGLDEVPGEVFVADIGIPATVYERLDIAYDRPFDDHDWLKLEG